MNKVQYIKTYYLYKSLSPRIAQYVGAFKSTSDYALLIQDIACKKWKQKRKTNRKDRYRVLIEYAGIFTEGW